MVACVPGCGRARPPIPLGASIGPIEFDAILKVIPRRTGSPEILFVRYWVASNYYRLAVIWAEPRGRGLHFPVFPQSLIAGSDERNFRTSHDIYPSYDVSLSKPIPNRGVFRCMFGDYPITNICYAERDAMATRLYRDDLWKGLDRYLGSNVTLALAAGDPHTNYKRDVTSLTVHARGGVIDSIEMFGKERRLLKKVEYEYYDKVNPICLSREHVFLPEGPMEVGLQSGGMSVAIAKHKYVFSDFPIIHEKGGRKCVVDYSRIPLGKVLLSVPVQIEVRDAVSGALLRSVRMTNFQQTELTSSESEQAAEHYAGLTAAHKKYRELLNKYWGKPVDHVSNADIEAIKQLSLYFHTASPAEENDLGEKLRRLNVLMDLNFMIGNEGEVERNYEGYMAALVEHHLPDMLLEGGYGVVEWAMVWGRFQDANRLMGLWLNSASREIDGESALRFAAAEIKKRDFWTCFEFLKHLPDDACSTAGSRFERAAMMCVSLHSLQELLRKRASLESGFPKMQVELASTTTSDEQLGKLSARCLSDAEQKLEATADLSELQKGLRKQLRDIEEAAKRGDTQTDGRQTNFVGKAQQLGLASKKRTVKTSHIVNCLGFRSQLANCSQAHCGRAGDCKTLRCNRRFGCEPGRVFRRRRDRPTPV